MLRPRLHLVRLDPVVRMLKATVKKLLVTCGVNFWNFFGHFSKVSLDAPKKFHQRKAKTYRSGDRLVRIWAISIICKSVDWNSMNYTKSNFSYQPIMHIMQKRRLKTKSNFSYQPITATASLWNGVEGNLRAQTAKNLLLIDFQWKNLDDNFLKSIPRHCKSRNWSRLRTALNHLVGANLHWIFKYLKSLKFC